MSTIGATAEHGLPHRRLCPDRRSEHRGAGRPRRLDRLAVLAAFRFRCLLCRAAGHARARPLADRAERRDAARYAPLPAQHADPGNALRNRRRRGDAHRLHAAAHRRLAYRAHGGGRARQGGDAHRAGAPLRLWRDRAVGDAARRANVAWDCRTRHGADALGCPAARRKLQDRRRLHHFGRRNGVLRAHLCALAR